MLMFSVGGKCVSFDILIGRYKPKQQSRFDNYSIMVIIGETLVGMLKMQRRSQKSLSEDKTYIPFSSQCQTVDVFSSETVHQVTQLTRKTVN